MPVPQIAELVQPDGHESKNSEPTLPVNPSLKTELEQAIVEPDKLPDVILLAVDPEKDAWGFTRLITAKPPDDVNLPPWINDLQIPESPV